LKKWLVIFVVFFSFLALYYYWGLFYEKEENTTAPLKTFMVEKGDLSVVVTATGTIKPYVEVEVKSEAAGEILSFPFEEGYELEKGRVVVRLDPEIETSRVNQARAELLMAEGKLERARVSRKDTELRLKRQEQLFEKGVISGQAYDDALIAHEKSLSEIKIADAELARAGEQLKEAVDRLEDTEIRAPARGTILEKFVEEGQVITSTVSSVSEGTLLFTMADLSRIYVEAMVDEVDIGRVAPGQRVKITVDAWPDRVFTGRVKRISPKGRVERTVTFFDVVIDITGNERGKLRPGMSANVEIVIDSVKDVLLVPSEALRKKDGETGVFMSGEEGPVWVPVTPGKTDGVLTEVKGLEAGGVVILSGLKKKKDEGPGSSMWRFLRYHGKK
jgi:HlyD family secretion protein